ncbi:MAG: hypothetical protein EOP48_03970, partial [Sphingobacteriales bacterium]
EFDNVFIVLIHLDEQADDCKRLLYVAMTRAKKSLTIHYSQHFLGTLVANQLTYTKDTMSYEAPKYMSCMLSHRNVQLGYFEFIQHRINGLTSGSRLVITPEGLATEKGLIVKFSNDFTGELNHLAKRGYVLDYAAANFIVHWWNKKNEKEVKIVLPEITFKKLQQK